ncbi:MAG: helix-turn-helix domain-containing protein [Dehalogenimonas sp.]
MKLKILDLLHSGAAINLTEAARQLGVNPQRAQDWKKSDEEFAQAVTDSQQILADNLESRLSKIENFIPMMFLLKKIRPEYRDNYRQTQIDPKFMEFLTKLAQIRQQPPEIQAPAAQIIDVQPIPVPLERAVPQKIKEALQNDKS